MQSLVTSFILDECPAPIQEQNLQNRDDTHAVPSDDHSVEPPAFNPPNTANAT